MKVIVLTGMPGSGKSIAVDIARSKGIEVYRMGEAVWAEVKARGLKLDKKIVGKIATEMRETHGPAIWAKRTIEMVRSEDRSDLMIIDGCRSKAEVETFKTEFGDDLLILAMIASEEIRYERLRARGRQDDIQDLDDFRERDERELRWGLGEVIEMADRKIKNEGHVDEARNTISELLNNLMEL